jgi:hypothetical protein
MCGRYRPGHDRVVHWLTRTRARRLSWLGIGASVAQLLLVTGCDERRDGTVGPPPVEPGSVDAGTVAIRVEYVGGFVAPSDDASGLPDVSVYDDGRVVTRGPEPPVIDDWYRPALPNVVLRRITPDSVAVLVRSALDAGVGSATDFGRVGAQEVDLPSARFTVATADGVKRLDVDGLLMDDYDYELTLTEAQRAARQKLRAFWTELREPSMAVGPSAPYPVSALAVIASPYPEQLPSYLPTLAEVAWPGPALPGQQLGPFAYMTCVTVTGDAVEPVLAAAETATDMTPWTWGGRRWKLALRPLLPDESGCADVYPRR